MRYQIADFRLDTNQCELSQSGNLIHLEPQALELLVLLIEKRNQVVSKEEINTKIWKGRIVSDAALSSRIKMIRQVLGDDGRKQQFIRTIHKKGFRFVSHTTESINHNSGMSDWVANDENEYVKKAIKFSTDLELLAEINKDLRRTALKSPLFNSTLFAEHLNKALWEMWNNSTLKM